MKRILLSCLIAGCSVLAMAQNPVKIRFVFQNENQPFALNEVLTAYNGVNYKAEVVAFYMSRVAIAHDGNQVTALDTNQVFYVNYNAPEIALGSLDISNVESVLFDVGVPEYLNHLDISQYPEGHPLGFQDPSMHWGWSAGYIHFLMNGHGDGNNDGVPEALYQLNCLGDENVHTVQVNTTATVHEDGSREIVVLCNLDQWLRNSDPATTGAAHGSTDVNAQVMTNITVYPVFVGPQNAAVTETEAIPLYVSVGASEVTVSWASVQAQRYRLINAEGKIITEGAVNGQQSLTLNGIHSGMHVVQLVSDQSVVLGSAKCIVP